MNTILAMVTVLAVALGATGWVLRAIDRRDSRKYRSAIKSAEQASRFGGG